MRFFLEYPLTDQDGGAWLRPANMVRFAQAAEVAGVDGIALTDHPAPSRKWLDSGGHNTLDPFAGLAFFAAATSTLRLMTYLTVVPYRNPFLLAKCMTSVDVLSGGRSTFTLGTGYLRSEFAALGVDLDDRNGAFDEGMEVVRGLLTSPHDYRYQGERFTGLGVTLSPPAVQKPYPPLWLGGNAKVVRQRVAQWGDGWAPLTLGGAALSKVSRTAPILSDIQLGSQIQQIKEEMVALGRDASALDVACPGTAYVAFDAGTQEKVDHVAGLAELGVTWTSVPLDRESYAGSLDALGAFGSEVIAKTR